MLTVTHQQEQEQATSGLEVDGMADCKKYSRLPDTYQELEYIQSGIIYLQTGYIDTGLVGTDLYGCEIETCMKVAVSTASNLYYLNGSYVAGQVTQTGLIREDYEYVHSIVNMGFNTPTYSGSIVLNDWHTIYTSDGIQKTDGTIVGNETYGTLNNLHYLLFARSDTGVTTSPPFAMKYFWIKKNGQYIRNMIPAKRKSDNAVGMYDIANDVFYTSENQFTFIGGGEVDYWLHSLRKYDGINWIDATVKEWDGSDWQ